MAVFEIYLVGLGVAHLLWFYFFTTGQLLVWKQGASTPFSLAHLVITTVAGMALSGFGLVFLGFAHLLNGSGMFLLFLLEGTLFWLLKRESWISGSFWRTTFRRFIEGWTPPALFIYVLFLVLGIPAVLPPTLGDSVSYHLAYAVDWANAGHIYVDPFLRFPYYANNFLLFYSALFILNLGTYCHFLNWLCGLLTCLGIAAFLTPVETQFCWKAWYRDFRPHQFLIPLCVALCPIFLRYLNVGLLDVPIGLFLLIPILCAYRTLSGEPLERELVVTAAFCMGMKLTLIGHLPFFLASLLVVCARRMRPRRIALFSVLLIALSLPWYARNLLEAGDPTPPVFNFYFNRPDPIFTKAEAAIYGIGVLTERNPLQLLLLPIRFFTHPESKNFLEPAVNAMTLLLYAPILLLLAQPFLRHRLRSPSRLLYLSVAVVYLAFPWFFSSLGRHALHWYPTLAAWVGVVISHACIHTDAASHSRWRTWAIRAMTAAFCVALIYPTPSRGIAFYRDYYEGIIASFRSRHDFEAYLEKNLSGYLASQAVIETLTLNQKENSRVLALLCEGLAFHFRKAKIVSVGDYFGPAGYGDLANEIWQGSCLPYLTRLSISAVIVRPGIQDPRWPLLYQKLRSQLKMGGFIEYRCRGGDDTPIFLKSDIRPVTSLIQTAP